MKTVLFVDASPWKIEGDRVVRISDILQERFEESGEFNVKRIEIIPSKRLGYYFGYFLAIIKIFFKLLVERFDILFISNYYLSFLTLVSKIKNRKSIVIYADIYPEFLEKIRTMPLRLYALLISGKFFSRTTDEIAIPSRTDIRSANAIGIPKEKIHMIRNPVDTKSTKFDENQREAIRAKFKIKNKFVIGYVGRLIDFYKIDKIVKAISLILEKDKIVFFLIGEGPERTKLKKVGNSLGVKIIDTGFVPHNEIYKYYSAMDLFVFPIDAIGIKTIETMAVGIPLIVPKGVAQEIIEDEKNGFLVEEATPENFAEKIEYVMKLNKTKIKEIKHNSMNLAKTEFDMEKVFKQYKELMT